MTIVPRRPRPGQSLAELRPEVSKEWDHEANHPLTPSDVSGQSKRKCHWICPKGHSWTVGVINRYNGNGCPVCRGYTTSTGHNDLATLRPDLAVEWDYSRNGSANPSQVSPEAHTKYFWICQKDQRHYWQSSPNDRSKGRGCGVCAGKVVLPGVNDLSTTHPDLAAQWADSNSLPSTEVLNGSSKRYEWVCEKMHTWVAAINDRANGNRTGCPECVTVASSKVELQLRQALHSLPDLTLIDSKISVPFRSKPSMSVDIVAVTGSGKRIAIEYDGCYWHQTRFEVDAEKSQILADAGYLVIRIREQSRHLSLEFLPVEHEGLVQLKHQYFGGPQDFTDLIDTLRELL